MVKNTHKPKRLVGLIHVLELGGAQRIMVNILNYFVLQNFEVHLIIFNNKGVLKNELNKKVIVHDIGIASVKKGMFKCLKHLRVIQPDIIFTGIGHLNLALSPFIPFMKFFLSESKWIARETNIVSLHNRASKYPKLFDWLYKKTYNNYDVIIAQSEDMKKDLSLNYAISRKVVVINNPINHKKISQFSLEEIKFKFDEHKINLLSVSQLREEKRHDLMLEVLTYLPTKYHLTIVGSGEKEEMLKELTQKLELEERVTFLGQQSNPYTYMKMADLFLLTSEREGFPNVLLEANILGVPIIAFSCQGGIKEIIDQGLNGFYVPFLECENMAKEIEKANAFNFNKNLIIENTVKRYGEENILKKYNSFLC